MSKTKTMEGMSKTKTMGIYVIYFHRKGDPPEEYIRDIIVVAAAFDEAVATARATMGKDEELQGVDFNGTVDVR